MVFGHSSIAIDHNTVLQIEGPGDKPITESFESFKSRFGEGQDDWIKIYRCVKPGAGKKAAQWTKENYENTDNRYLVTLNLKVNDLHTVLKLSTKHIRKA